MSEKLELRSNAYFPFGVDRTVTSSEIVLTPGTAPEFRENFISVDTLGTFQTFEQTLKGVDVEVGTRLNGLSGDDENWLIRGYVGGYYYDNPDLRDFTGVSLRLNANYRDSVETNLKVQNDRFFGTQAAFGLTMYLDPLFYRNQAFHSRTRDVRNHMARPVERKQLLTVVRGSALIGPPVPLDLTDPTTNNPITVTHVDSSDMGANDGTVENPFQTLSDAAGSNTDLVYVHSASTFDGEGYALAANQRFLGEGDHVVHTVDTAEFGMIPLPVANDPALAKPVINNSPANAITLASNTEVSNFQIADAVGSSIFADAAANSIVSLVMAANSTGPAISLNDSSVSIFDSMFSTMTANAHGALISGNSNVLFDKVQLSTMGDDAFGLLALDTSIVQFLNSSQITTDGVDAYGVHLLGTSLFTMDNSAITTLDARSTGVLARDVSVANILNGSIVTLMDLGGVGVNAADNSLISIDASQITTHGVDSPGAAGRLSISGGSVITTNGDNSTAVFVGGAPIEIVGSTLKTFGAGAKGVIINAPSGGSVLRLVNSNVDSDLDLEIDAVVAAFTPPIEMEIHGNFLQGSSGEVTFGTGGFGASLTIFGPSFNSQNVFSTSNGLAGGTINQFGNVFYSALP